MDYVIQILTAFLGSMGFAILFGLRKKILWISSLGGLISWSVYLLVDALMKQTNLFVPCFAATLVAVFYVDFVAYRIKMPTFALMLPSLIPLIPGSTLYYCFFSFYKRNWAEMVSYAGKTFVFVFAIASGLSVAWIIKNIRQKKA